MSMMGFHKHSSILLLISRRGAALRSLIPVTPDGWVSMFGHLNGGTNFFTSLIGNPWAYGKRLLGF